MCLVVSVYTIDFYLFIFLYWCFVFVYLNIFTKTLILFYSYLDRYLSPCPLVWYVPIALKATEQKEKNHKFTFSFSKGTRLWWHLSFYLLHRNSCTRQTHTIIFIKIFHFFISSLSIPLLMMRRNATALMVMSPVLACLSQEVCEPQFGQTKASITKTPRGDFQSSFCALCTQCVFHVTRQVPHFLPSSNWSFLKKFSFHSHGNLACYTSYHQHYCRAINILVTTCAWCNSEEILSGCPGFFFGFFFTCGFLKSLDAFTDGNKDKFGLCVFLVVSLSCHLATPDNLHQRMLPFRRTCSLFLCSLPLFCHILCEWQMLHWLCLYIHVCACVHSGTHNTSLTAGPSLQALGCLLLTLHICLSSSLSLSPSLVLYLLLSHFSRMPQKKTFTPFHYTFAQTLHLSLVLLIGQYY